MFKKLAQLVISLYLLPLKLNERLFYYVRGVFFTEATEHLYRATQYIKKHVAMSREEIIIDVGGADGRTSICFAKAFPELTVHCIEPNTRMLPLLKAVESKHEKVVVKALALGAAIGEAILHVTANNLSSSLNEPSLEELKLTHPELQARLREEQQIPVRVSTLDEEFKDSPCVLLIKLDTQGTELEILRGGVKTLTRTRFILTEMNNHRLYQNTNQYYEVDEFLRSKSFRLTDVVVTYRGDEGLTEYDALYENTSL